MEPLNRMELAAARKNGKRVPALALFTFLLYLSDPGTEFPVEGARANADALGEVVKPECTFSDTGLNI